MDSSNWKAKAEEFLRSHLGDDNTNSEEAAVYFLSRGNKGKAVEKAITNAKQRWSKDPFVRHGNLIWNQNRVGTLLRLVQWAKIGPISKYDQEIAQDLAVDHNAFSMLHSNYAAFDAFYLPLYCSDLTVKFVPHKLGILVLRWQEFLDAVIVKQGYWGPDLRDEIPIEQILCTLIAAYILGVIRIPNLSYNQTVYQKSIECLFDNQSESGLWGDDGSEPGNKNVILAAMGIHALYHTKQYGWDTCAQKAGEWLLKQQSSDGGWYAFNQEKDLQHQSCFITSFVLDALEIMVFSGNRIPTLTYAQDIDFKEDRPEKKSHERVPFKQIPTKMEDQRRQHFIKELSQTVIVIENLGGLTVYKNGISTETSKLGSKLALNLIQYLAERDSIPSSKVRDATGSKINSETGKGRKPREIIREVNMSLVGFLKKNNIKGFSELPNDFEIINNSDDKNSYKSLVQISTREKVERLSLKPDKKGVYDFKDLAR